MSWRQGADAKDAIEDVYNSFSDLRQEAVDDTAILYGRHFAQLLRDLTELDFPTKVPVASQAMAQYSHDAEAEMRVDLEFHVSTDERRRSKGDALEICGSWIWNQLNPGNRTLRAVVQAMLVRPFAAVWEVPISFQPPKGKPTDPEVDKYVRHYFPIDLEVDSGAQSAFLEKDGIVKLAVRKYQQSFVELAKAYDKKPERKRQPLNILQEDYPDLIMGYGVGQDEQSLLRKDQEVFVLDDGEHICVYIDMARGGENRHKGQRYYSISDDEGNEPYPNYAGRPMFHFASAFWNPVATKPEDRYESFMRVATRERYAMDRIQSVIMSAASSLPLRIIEAEPALLEQLKGMDLKERKEFMETMMVKEIKGTLFAMGELKQLEMPVPEALQFVYNEHKEEYLRHLPTQPFNDTTVRNAQATALAQQVQIRNQRYLMPTEGLAGLVADVIQDVFSIYRTREESLVLNTPGAKWKKGLYVHTTGSEQPKGKTASAGKNIVLDEDLLGEDDDWYKFEVLPVDNSPSARSLRRVEARERQMDRTIIETDRLELNGITDPEDYKDKLREQMWEETFARPQAALAFTDAVQFASQFYGVNDMQLLAATQGAPIQNAQGEQVTPEGASGGPVQYQLQPPGDDTTPQAVAGG